MKTKGRGRSHHFEKFDAEPRCFRFAVVLLAALAGAATYAQTNVTDPAGDISTPTQYLGLPFGGPVTEVASELELDVPDFLLTDPITNWVAGSTERDGPIFDLVPDVGVNTVTEVEVADPANDTPLAIQDLLSAGIFESGSSNTLLMELRDLGDPGPSNTDLFFAVNYVDGTPARSAGLFNTTPSHNFWAEFVNAIGVPFPFTPTAYYDLVAADLEVFPTELSARIHVDAAIPTPPPEVLGATPYTPSFRISLNVDGDDATGDATGLDQLYSAYFDTSGVLTVGRRAFNGSYFEIAPEGTASASIAGNIITIIIPRSHFTLDETDFRWTPDVDLLVSETVVVDRDDYWFASVDSAGVTGPGVVLIDGFESGDTSAWE